MINHFVDADREESPIKTNKYKFLLGLKGIITCFFVIIILCVLIMKSYKGKEQMITLLQKENTELITSLILQQEENNIMNSTIFHQKGEIHNLTYQLMILRSQFNKMTNTCGHLNKKIEEVQSRLNNKTR